MERLIAGDAVSFLVKGADAGPSDDHVGQELLHERGYEDFDLSLLDVLR